MVDILNSSPITVSDIKSYTATDHILFKVVTLVSRGWKNNIGTGEDFTPYSRRYSELSIVDGCVLWGSRVITPPKLWERVLDEIHKSHLGIVKMKAIARSYVWWLKLDDDIEKKVSSCDVCQLSRNSPPPALLHTWEWPARPWSRLHIDYAGPYLGQMFLIIIDSHSKWLEVLPVKAATSSETIGKLRQLFSTFGLPDKIVSNNGSVFTSREFADFMASNGISHVKVAPYHPSSNGLAERDVKLLEL